MMNWNTYLESIAVEITSYCNAKCPGCTRNDNFTGEPIIKPIHMEMHVWKELCNTIRNDRIKIKTLTFGGNNGDAIMHPHIIDFINMFWEASPETVINIQTNGSMRSVDWWSTLGSVLSNNHRHMVDIAIDGLEDTHEIYRVSAPFAKVLENTKALINSGAKVKVVTTAFTHNDHQIDAIKELAETVGAYTFLVRPSYNDIIPTSSKAIYTSNVYNSPRVYKFKSVGFKIDIAEDKGSPCKWYNMGKIWITPDGVVQPCCMLNINDYPDSYDKSLYSLEHHTLSEILNTIWFTEVLEERIKNRMFKACILNCL